jgi:hypothetical protein
MATEPNPIAVVMVKNPWATVIGSDSPRFAYYDDGTAIFAAFGDMRTAHRPPYAVANLPAATWQALLPHSLVERFFALDPGTHGDRVGITDAPSNQVFLWRDGQRHAVEAYGDFMNLLRDDGPSVFRRDVPWEFLDVFDRLICCLPPQPWRPWLPPRFEIMLWPFDDASLAPIEWPADFPGLDDPRTRRRGDSFSLYSEAGRFKEFLTLLEARDGSDGNHPVLLGGRKWAMSYRWPFAREDLWMGWQPPRVVALLERLKRGPNPSPLPPP